MEKSIIITYDDVMALEENNVTLTEEDLVCIEDSTSTEVYEHQKLIDDTVNLVEDYFKDIRRTRKVPLVDLRRDIVPMISSVTDGTNLLHLFAALQAKDDYTYRHNIAVGIITHLLGKWLKLEHQELMQLTTAALLHDVGKMFIPEYILNKPGRLTDEEYEMMKKHTVFGYELLRNTVGISHRQALVALQHHERMDGSGYPFGIKKEKIDYFSRIVAVADIFHAMTSKRVYRNPSPFYEILFQMERDTFGVLDAAITRLFIEKIMTRLIGYPVLLTDNRKGTIIMVHPHHPTRPLLKVDDSFIDLRKDSSVHILKVLN